MGFGSRLLDLRKQRGLSQAELASMLNTRAPVIGRYEREEATPSVEVATRLSNILGVSLDFLVGNTELQLDSDTLKRVEDITKMQPEERSFILKALDALVRDTKARKAYA